jgi:regulator of replication initiation timing
VINTVAYAPSLRVVLFLRDEALALRQVQKTLRREHTEQIRDLETAIRAYANQIQTLALRNDELTDENTRLRHRLEQQDTNVTELPQRT